MSVAEFVPSPADASRLSAEDLLASFADEGARIFRFIEPPRVFLLTQSEELAGRIIRLGGRVHIPAHMRPGHLAAPYGADLRRPGVWEWDIEINGIPVSGDETLWEAAGAYRRGKRE